MEQGVPLLVFAGPGPGTRLGHKWRGASRYAVLADLEAQPGQRGAHPLAAVHRFQRAHAVQHPLGPGRGLQVVIAAILEWNDRFDAAPTGPGSRIVDASDGAALDLAFRGADGRIVEPDEVAIVPGRGDTWAAPAKAQPAGVGSSVV